MSIFVDPTDLTIVPLLFLLVVYGFILSKSSALISDGSELLLLIPSLAGIVGSVVLPVLGAVPDGAIVLFSGFGPDVDQQISVGVGALAGSTIMLLTIPWGLCIIMGRVDIVGGEANYKMKPKVTTRWQELFASGVTPRRSVGKNGIIMIVTAVSYVVIQISAFVASCDHSDPSKEKEDCKRGDEHWVALAALLMCIAFFAGYLWYNVKNANSEDEQDFIQEVKKQAIESHEISISAAFERDLLGFPKEASTSLLSVEEGEKRFNETLKSFFKRYDRDGNGVIDPFELKFLLKDIGEDMPEDKFNVFMKEIDSDASGTINFSEFSVAMKRFVQKKNEGAARGEANMQALTVQAQNDGGPAHHSHHGEEHKEKEGEEEEEEEEEEVPEDLASLPPNKQRMRILLRAGWMMLVGTAITLLFSDPMVDVLNNLGDRLHVGSFYIAFVLAPVASNASELIASINYATKKTKKTITISLAALEGAACMNNTFCLGIFLILIFAKNLAWQFSAETISILLVELALFAFTLKETHKIFDAFIILSLYPISIFVVWFLENVAHLN